MCGAALKFRLIVGAKLGRLRRQLGFKTVDKLASKVAIYVCTTTSRHLCSDRNVVNVGKEARRPSIYT